MSGEHFELELPGAHVLFTTRRGGHSTGAYESLNLGRWTDDEPAAVERNRSGLAAALGVEFAYGRQVHGARVQRAGAPGREVEEADGQATGAIGLAPMVLVADCLPIAIAARGAVAMLHAGWRGLAGGVVAEGVRAVRELGGEGPIAAAIGPGAGACCYEVGDEVHAVFDGTSWPATRRGRNLDLNAIARAHLQDAGVSTIEEVGLCTICNPELFFSHRRDNGVTGRQAGIAWLS